MTYMSAIANDVVAMFDEAAVLRSRSASSRRCPSTRPATMNTTISATLQDREHLLDAPADLGIERVQRVIATISTRSRSTSAECDRDRRDRRRAVRRGTSRTQIAAAAIAAENPAVSETQPLMKPSAG